MPIDQSWRYHRPTKKLMTWISRLKWDHVYEEWKLKELGNLGVLYDSDARRLYTMNCESYAEAPVLSFGEWDQRRHDGEPTPGAVSSFRSLWRKFRAAELLCALLELFDVEDPATGQTLSGSAAFEARRRALHARVVVKERAPSPPSSRLFSVHERRRGR